MATPSFGCIGWLFAPSTSDHRIGPGGAPHGAGPAEESPCRLFRLEPGRPRHSCRAPGCRAILGFKIVVHISLTLGFDPIGAEADEAIDQIAASGARLCLVALGAPKQEVFTARAMERLLQYGFVSALAQASISSLARSAGLRNGGGAWRSNGYGTSRATIAAWLVAIWTAPDFS